ncbi:MAG: DUF305 domain-containing protein [Acidimicrobiales bacterium]
MKNRYAIAPLIVSAGLLIGACSSDHGSMTDMNSASNASTIVIPEGANFNSTDVGFAQGMIPHHAQAVEMSDMAIEESSNPEILRLARNIKAAQQPEIDQMTGWLTGWGQKVPEASGAHSMDGMDSMMMAGMMSEADMAKLEQSSGASFDRLWLELMVLHHEGALEMVPDEISGGKNPDVIALANTIATSQQAEINEMNALIASLPS